MMIIASYSIKGGVGKTALSVNLAYALSQAGCHTLLVDLDPQGAAAFYFRVGPAKRIKWKKSRKLSERLKDNIRESDYPCLDILPSSLAYRNFDIALNRMKRSKRQLLNLLQPLQADYDAIVLDSPPNITLLSENIFRAANLLLVPVIPTTLSQRTLEQLYAFFARKKLPDKAIIPLFNMVQGRNRMHTDTMASLRNRYPAFLQTKIPLSVDIERMGLERRPVLTYTTKRSPARAYEHLTNEIIEKLAENKP